MRTQAFHILHEVLKNMAWEGLDMWLVLLNVMTLCIYLFVFMNTCVVESCFEHLMLLTMNPTSIPSTSSRARADA